MFEIRVVLEIGVADFLFQRIKKEDINELKEIVNKEPAITDFRLFNMITRLPSTVNCMK